MSSRTIDIFVSTVWTNNQFASIIATVAASDTRIVVHGPAGWACSPRSRPTRNPAVKPSASRNRTSPRKASGSWNQAQKRG